MRDPGKITDIESNTITEATKLRNDNLFMAIVTNSGRGQPSYYMNLINIHDIEVSISVWVSHTIPDLLLHVALPRC